MKPVSITIEGSLEERQLFCEKMKQKCNLQFSFIKMTYENYENYKTTICGTNVKSDLHFNLSELSFNTIKVRFRKYIKTKEIENIANMERKFEIEKQKTIDKINLKSEIKKLADKAGKTLKEYPSQVKKLKERCKLAKTIDEAKSIILEYC